MSDTVEVRQAAQSPCRGCPWRLANQGQRHQHGFYCQANLARLWARLRRGERMTCHPTDPRMAEFEGYERAAGAKFTTECAGALILQQREVDTFQRLIKAGGTLADYRQRRPRGMARGGCLRIGSRRLVGVPGAVPMTAMNLDTPGIGHELLGEWTPPTTASEVTTNAEGDGA